MVLEMKKNIIKISIIVLLAGCLAGDITKIEGILTTRGTPPDWQELFLLTQKYEYTSSNPKILFILARSYQHKNDYVRSAEILVKIFQNKDAEHILAKWVKDMRKKGMSPFLAKWFLAEIYFRAGKITDAIEIRKDLVENLKGEKQNEPLLAFLYGEIGRGLVDLGQYKEAEKYLISSLKYEKNNIFSVCYLASAYYRNNKIDLAEKVLSKIKAVEILGNLEKYVVYSAYGDLYAAKKNYPGAIKFYNDALNILSSDYTLLYGVGNCYYALEKYDMAKTYYEKAIKIREQPDIFYGLVVTYYMLGEHKKADDTYKILLKKFPDYALSAKLKQIIDYGRTLKKSD